MEGSKLVSVSVLVDTGKKMRVLEPTVECKTFGELGLVEDDIETFLDGNLDVLLSGDESALSLLQIGRQVPNEFGGECDLLAIDSNGSIVVIEIKRDPKDCRARVEAFEMQSIRYASSFTRINTPEELAEQVYVPYLLKYMRDVIACLDVHDYAKQRLDDFLRANKSRAEFNQKQKIILVASGFDPETKSACAWLRKNGVDISCIQITPLAHGAQNYLLIERIIPPPALEDMLAKVGKRKSIRTTNTGDPIIGRGTRTKLMNTADMLTQGILARGDTVIVKDRPESAATIEDYKTVIFQGSPVSWNVWAKKITGWSAVNIYANVTKDGKTLDELRFSDE